MGGLFLPRAAPLLLPHARNDNQALARYINAKRKEEAQKKEETQKKVEEEAYKKAMKGQNSKDVWP
jgi:hypothetical protein